MVLLNAQSNLVAELSSFFWATMLDTQPQVTPAPKRKKNVRKVAQQLESFFIPDELEEEAPWIVPMQMPMQMSMQWSEADDHQLAFWAAEGIEQPAP